MRARIGFLVTFALAAWLLGAGASSKPPGIGYLDGAVSAQDEAVYSHAAIRMAETGEWSTPMFLGRFFLYKPPLIYWLSGASAKWFGVSALSLRLPSILAASFTAAVVFVWVMSAANWWRAWLAVILLAAGPLYVELGRRNMTDATVMAVIVGSAWILARGKPLAALTGCIAIGILAKSIAGLIPIAIAGAWWLGTATAGRPPLRRLVWACGLGVLLAAPWFAYQWETHRRWFEAEFIGVELLAYGASAPPQTSAEPSLVFYPSRLWSNSAYLCVLFLAALPAFFGELRRSKPPGATALAAAMAVMTAAILAYQYRNATYLLPLLPLLAIVAATYSPAWTLGVVSLWGAAWTGYQMLSIAREPEPVPAVWRLARQYCEMDRGNDLIVVGIPDDFAISTLPLARLRYAIQGAVRSEGQVTLDFIRIGVVLPVSEFNSLAAARARYLPKLQAWGLANDEALGSVIGWERSEDLAALVRANPERDFLFPGLPGPEPPPSAGTHLAVAGERGLVLLLSRGNLPRATPQGRSCRL